MVVLSEHLQNGSRGHQKAHLVTFVPCVYSDAAGESWTRRRQGGYWSAVTTSSDGLQVLIVADNGTLLSKSHYTTINELAADHSDNYCCLHKHFPPIQNNTMIVYNRQGGPSSSAPILWLRAGRPGT